MTMFGNNLVFWWCCALLLVASSSKHQRNFTNNNEKHDISTAQYKIDKNSTENYDEKEIDISTIHTETDCNKDSNECFVPYEICDGDDCDPFCCHLDDFLTEFDECIPEELRAFEAFVDEQYSLQSKNQEINLTVYEYSYDPCQKIKEFQIYNYYDIDSNVLIAKGTVYFPYHLEFVESKSFCLMDDNENMLHTGCNITIFNINFPTEIVKRILLYKLDSPNNPINTIRNHYMNISVSLRIISILFLLTIFLVYSILPQLRNKHGFILRNCIGATIVAHIFDSMRKLTSGKYVMYFIQLTIVSVHYFCFLATYFWLTVMSFDMWWTFRDISSLLPANVRNRQQERERKKKDRKKLIMYFVYAWGISFTLTMVNYVTMDSDPFASYTSLRPEFGIIIYLLNFTKSFRTMEIGWYFWIPSTICNICSICLFISTALKIRRYEKNTTCHLRNVDNRVYDENKKWFNLWQKWFIMMFIVIGISAFIGIVLLIFPYTPNLWYIDYIAYLTDMAQDIGIFIIFVCKKRIKKLLLTRFGYQNDNVPPIARQTEVVTDSNTRTIRSRMIHLRERINLWQTNRRRNNMHDETAM